MQCLGESLCLILEALRFTGARLATLRAGVRVCGVQLRRSFDYRLYDVGRQHVIAKHRDHGHIEVAEVGGKGISAAGTARPIGRARLTGRIHPPGCCTCSRPSAAPACSFA
jgi:hypothetical protein